MHSTYANSNNWLMDYNSCFYNIQSLISSTSSCSWHFNVNLNLYSKCKQGFRKVDPDRWEFANEGFLKGQKHLLKTIKRRRPPPHPPSQNPSLTPYLEVGHFGLDGEIDRLKRDKNILMAELVEVRQEQQNTRAHLKAMEERLQGIEQKQQQMMAFLARAMRNPNFLQQLAQQNDKKKELEEDLSKKRRRPIEHFPHCDVGGISGVQFKNEGERLREIYGGCEVPELESLALEMQGFRSEENKEQQEEVDVELNDEFWEELLNENIGEENGGTEFEERGGDDVNLLSEKLAYMSSTSPR